MKKANTFTLRIRLGNDAMRTHADVARALRDSVISYLCNFRNGEAPLCSDSDAIRDSNGNRVGGWHFSNEEA